jgi:hypothetical protein
MKPLAVCLLMLSSALAQEKPITIGKFTYIGESPDGTSEFVLDLVANSKFAVQPAILDFVVYEKATVTDTQSNGPTTAPAGYLFAFGQINGTVNCSTLCPAVTLQLVLSNNPTTTYRLANGQLFTADSIQNIYLSAPQGQATLQLGQFVPIVLSPIARQAH